MHELVPNLSDLSEPFLNLSGLCVDCCTCLCIILCQTLLKYLFLTKLYCENNRTGTKALRSPQVFVYQKLLLVIIRDCVGLGISCWVSCIIDNKSLIDIYIAIKFLTLFSDLNVILIVGAQRQRMHQRTSRFVS